MIWALAALLLLQPALQEPGAVRLVATGPIQPITWIVDGVEAGTTGQQQAFTVALQAGEHAVVARTAHRGPWQVMARLDTPGPGIAYTLAWTAASTGEGPKVIPGTSALQLVTGLAVAVWAQSKRP
jgi:hypothetical protein